MIDIIKNLLDLTTGFINRIYNIEIDLTPTMNVKLGTLTLAFIFFVLVIYFILKTIGILKEDE